MSIQLPKYVGLGPRLLMPFWKIRSFSKCQLRSNKNLGLKTLTSDLDTVTTMYFDVVYRLLPALRGSFAKTASTVIEVQLQGIKQEGQPLHFPLAPIEGLAKISLKFRFVPRLTATK